MSGRVGKLFYHVIEAKEMKEKDNYIKAYLDKKKVFQSTIILKTKDPKWDENAQLLDIGKDEIPSTFKVAVWDENMIFPNQYQGDFEFDFKELMDGVPRDAFFPIKKKGKPAKGEVHMRLVFLKGDEDISTDYGEFTHPLQTLMAKGSTDAFNNTLKSGKADLNLENKEGLTPLQIAAKLNKIEYMESLLKHRADVNTKASGGNTALHTAAAHSSACVKALLDQGAEADTANKEGSVPLHMALQANNPDAVDLLVAASAASINAQDNGGNTPLHVALQQKDGASKAAISALLKHKPNVFLTNNEKLDATEFCQNPKFVDESTYAAFMDASGFTDPREFSLADRFSKDNRTVLLSGETLSEDWRENDHVCLKSVSAKKIAIIFAYRDNVEVTALPMEKCGFTVIKTPEDIHKAVSFQQENVGFGTSSPFNIFVDEENKDKVFSCIIPFAKTSSVNGKWSLICYADGEVTFSALKAWKHSTTIKGEWKEASAGGCKTEPTFKKNPMFTLSLPEGSKVPVNIILAQEKSSLDYNEYAVNAYQFFIGFYVLDPSVRKLLGGIDKWKNAREHYCYLTLDSSKYEEYVIVPTTFKPAQETTFTLTVYSDEPLTLKPK